MRIRKEDKGDSTIVNCSVEIDKPLDAINDEAMLHLLMENYGIPLAIEMMTKMLKALQHDFKKSDKKKYFFTLSAYDITEKQNAN